MALNAPLTNAAHRAELVELARSVGANEAARRHGLKPSTVRQWISRAQRATALVEFTDRVGGALPAEVVQAALAEMERAPRLLPAERPSELGGEVEVISDRTTPWRGRVPNVALALGHLVEVSMAATVKAVEQGKSRQARELATVFAIAIDKAQLLSGGATDRTQTQSVAVSLQLPADSTEVAAELARVRAELGIDAPPPRAAIEASSAADDDQEDDHE